MLRTINFSSVPSGLLQLSKPGFLVFMLLTLLIVSCGYPIKCIRIAVSTGWGESGLQRPSPLSFEHFRAKRLWNPPPPTRPVRLWAFVWTQSIYIVQITTTFQLQVTTEVYCNPWQHFYYKSRETYCKFRKIVTLFRPSQVHKKQNAHCVDKHLKQRHSLRLFTWRFLCFHIHQQNLPLITVLKC